jgi:4-hydroxy-tetrahydrodipicolinate reductase
MAIRVLVNGAAGKTGQVACQAIGADAGLELVGTGGRGDDLAALIQKVQPDVVLDLTVASVVFANASAIVSCGVRPVIGTSGLLQEQVEELGRCCREQSLGGVIAPNFSLSAVLMMKYAREAAPYFSRVEIVEAHHEQKRDSPSGTALRTAEMVAETWDKPEPVKSEDTVEGARGASYRGVPIHSLRLPGRIAHQEVLLGGPGEILSIKSDLVDRDAFSPGILLACKKVMELDQLKYGLEDLL